MTVAGWYSDPERLGYLRYWDGAQWTSDVIQSAPSAEARRASNLRVLSVIVAVLLWFPLGLVCGIVGFKLSNRARAAAEAGDLATAKKLLNKTRTWLLIAVAGLVVYAVVLMTAVFTNRI